MALRQFHKWLAAFCILFMSGPVVAGEADVVEATVRQAADGSYAFTVTVRHADEGWTHYADKWEVVSPDGTVLATRILAHPHVSEQPFTRSLSGVALPDDIDQVIIRAGDSVHELGGEEVVLAIPR